jgi:hypothetical protein
MTDRPINLGSVKNINPSYLATLKAISNKLKRQNVVLTPKLAKNITFMVKWIVENYQEAGTKSGYLVAYHHLLKRLGVQTRKLKDLSKLMTSYRNTETAEKEGNKLTEKEMKNMHSFECYSSIREQHIQAFQQHAGDKKFMYRALIIAFNTLNPPMRLSDNLDIVLTAEKPPKQSPENFIYYDVNTAWLIMNSTVKVGRRLKVKLVK